MEEDNNIKSNTADHLANERTLLAWIRTSIGIITFGFVLVKTPDFISSKNASGNESLNYTALTGLVMVILATLSLLFAYIGYSRTKRQLDSGHYKHSSMLLLTLVTFLFVSGLIVVIVLLKDFI